MLHSKATSCIVQHRGRSALGRAVMMPLALTISSHHPAPAWNEQALTNTVPTAKLVGEGHYYDLDINDCKRYLDWALAEPTKQ